MTNFQPVRAKAPNKAVNLPDGRVVTRNGIQTVDIDLGPVDALITADKIEVHTSGYTAVGNDPVPAPFVRQNELATALEDYALAADLADYIPAPTVAPVEGQVLSFIGGEIVWATP